MENKQDKLVLIHVTITTCVLLKKKHTRVLSVVNRMSLNTGIIASGGIANTGVLNPSLHTQRLNAQPTLSMR